MMTCSLSHWHSFIGLESNSVYMQRIGFYNHIIWVPLSSFSNSSLVQPQSSQDAYRLFKSSISIGLTGYSTFSCCMSVYRLSWFDELRQKTWNTKWFKYTVKAIRETFGESWGNRRQSRMQGLKKTEKDATPWHERENWSSFAKKNSKKSQRSERNP